MATRQISQKWTGVVVSAGCMDKAVKVRIAGQEWNKQVRKFFPSSKTYLVSDPNSSLVEGDVVRIASGWRTSRNIRHVVDQIIAPFGEPIDKRPRVLTEAQRIAEREKERLEKDVRRASRGKFASVQRIEEAKEQGKEIPTLEHAMRHIRAKEREEAERIARRKGGRLEGEHRELSKREKRTLERQMTDAEREAAKLASKAEHQAEPKTPNVKVSKD